MRNAWIALAVWAACVVAGAAWLAGCDRDAVPVPTPSDMAVAEPDLGRCGYNWMPCCQAKGEAPCWDATSCFNGTCAACGLAGLPCCPPGTPGVTECVLPATCGAGVCR